MVNLYNNNKNKLYGLLERFKKQNYFYNHLNVVLRLGFM